MTPPYAIRFQDFSFSYPQAAFTLGPLDWSVREGAFALLLGKTGSGKTTLLKCLVPALAPRGNTSGSVELKGRTLNTYTPQEACSVVGYVPQNPEASIVCQTVIAELAFGLENLGINSVEASKRIAEIVAFFGMESWIHQETATLSGGQKQTLALAAVLVMRPSILILDEPLTQLDPVAQKTFASLLFRVNKELRITIVVATHDPFTLAPYATEAVTLSSSGIAPVSLDTFSLKPWRPPAKPAYSQQEEVIAVKNAWFRFDRQSPWVLQGAQSVCQKGQCIALIGSNGAGKTTYLQLVAQVLKSTLGKVKNRLKDNQAYLPQNPHMLLACDSVVEELQEWQAGAGYTNEALESMLATLELEDKKTLHPLDLSGGEQQKLALGKLLLLQPELLLLDEPTKGLDYETKTLVTRLLMKALRQGTTIIMATHDLACAAYLADRIWLLFDGRITSDAAPQDFFTDTIFYQAYEDPYTHALDTLEFDE